jgi:predicted Fe-Mo cluster-binding NifX family protein
MKKKIAIPIDNFGNLDAHFGHCKYFAIIEVDGQTIVSQDKIVPPPHEPGLLPRFLAEKGVTDIIAGGMGQKAIQLFNQQKVNAFVGAPRQAASELVEGFLNNTLSFSANYCDH